MSRIEIMRAIDAMDETAWKMIGLDDEGPGWVHYMWDDCHPSFFRQYDKLHAMLHEEEEEEQPWVH